VIECNPQGICSRDYYLSGDGHNGSVEFDWIGEQGSMNLDGKFYQVSKDGFFESVWTLTAGSQVVATARKLSIFSRSIEIQSASGTLLLEKATLFSRAMTLQGPRCNCLIAPAHPFTRRATIEGQWHDFAEVAFGFWLTAILWKRQRNSSSAAATGAH
jgi:hypothetical protein